MWTCLNPSVQPLSLKCPHGAWAGLVPTSAEYTGKLAFPSWDMGRGGECAQELVSFWIHTWAASQHQVFTPAGHLAWWAGLWSHSRAGGPVSLCPPGLPCAPLTGRVRGEAAMFHLFLLHWIMDRAYSPWESHFWGIGRNWVESKRRSYRWWLRGHTGRGTEHLAGFTKKKKEAFSCCEVKKVILKNPYSKDKNRIKQTF